jgi:hypothetical protein
MLVLVFLATVVVYVVVSGCRARQKRVPDLVSAPSIFGINQSATDVASKTDKYTQLHESGMHSAYVYLVSLLACRHYGSLLLCYCSWWHEGRPRVECANNDKLLL